jgi:hypothetical protein
MVGVIIILEQFRIVVCACPEGFQGLGVVAAETTTIYIVIIIIIKAELCYLHNVGWSHTPNSPLSTRKTK